MRRLLFILSLFFFLSRVQAQTPDTLAPYLKYRNLPAFNLLLPDSSTQFNTYHIKKGKPSVLILFSPDCHHCEQLTAMILEQLPKLRGVNIIMGSPLPLYQIKAFMAKTGLDKHKQIVVGHDPSFFFWSFYRADTVPFVVVYDRDKQLAGAIPKLKKIEELLDMLKTAR